ncbi:hypothetical protein [Paenibacillus amylolyticus]|uniref:hypothetical protein n=1 Tax=Paenibacillus amylolyticus TaxID=1451 RepID=UPI00286CB651|nr:hypothetical protein [Paenibacillus amylolyticus]
MTLQKTELQGHDVFELMQGRLQDTHWLESSVYLTEEVINETEFVKLCTHCLVNFNYYGPTEVNRAEWQQMKQMAESSESVRTRQLIAEMDAWAIVCFQNHSCFTICGI